MEFQMITKCFYRLLPLQVPLFWEAIKFAVSRTEALGVEDKPEVYTDLLHSLLNGTSQCIVILDSSKTLVGIVITSVMANKLTLKKELLIRSLYSMQQFSDDERLYGMDLARKLALKEGCSSIGFTTGNERLWHWADVLKIKEQHRYFSVEVKN
jgi:hypothetical protein